MERQDALLQEFASRKDHVLNLEVRLFVLALAIEAFFILVYVFNVDRVRQSSAFAFGATMVYFAILFHMVAINGKMGVVSMYLRQMEQFLASLGYVGAVWESRALGMIIFRPGNAFTLPAALTVLILLMQTFYVIYLQVSHITSSSGARIALNVAIGILFVFVLAKTVTVDFYRKLPGVFGEGSSTSEAANETKQ